MILGDENPWMVVSPKAKKILAGEID